jgi:hypothetical protein
MLGRSSLGALALRGELVAPVVQAIGGFSTWIEPSSGRIQTSNTYSAPFTAESFFSAFSRP